MKACVAVLVLALGANAFVPAALRPAARGVVRMSAEESQSRRDFGAALVAGVAGLGLAQSAQAEAGAGPSFSLFGIIGDKGSMSEGAAYGSDQSAPVYSPYSPYGSIRDESLAVKANSIVDVELYKKKVAESTKRLDNIPAYIEKKQWLEVKTELTRQMYDLRKSMNGLATTKEAKAAAKAFYQDIEALTLYSNQKNQAAAAAAYAKSVESLKKYKSLI